MSSDVAQLWRSLCLSLTTWGQPCLPKVPRHDRLWFSDVFSNRFGNCYCLTIIDRFTPLARSYSN